MILLDAYALVAFFGEERAADDVEGLLRRGKCAISLVNLAEALDVSGRVHALSPEEMRPVIEMLVETAQLELVAPSEAVAWRAAALRQAHYKPRSVKSRLPTPSSWPLRGRETRSRLRIHVSLASRAMRTSV